MVQRKITEIDRAVILSGVSTGTSVPISQIFLGIPLHFSKTMIAFRGRGQPGLSHALVPALGVQEVVVWTAFYFCLSGLPCPVVSWKLFCLIFSSML